MHIATSFATHHKDLLTFAATILATTRRIALATTVQVLADLAVFAAPSRTVRVFSLVGIAVFFLFLQRTVRMGMVRPKGAPPP